MTNNTISDVEVYVRCPNALPIIDWFKNRFPAAEAIELKGLPKGSSSFSIQQNQFTIPVIIIDQAIKGYVSILFDSPHSPWETDKELAQEIQANLGFIVRFSDGLWSQGDDPDSWIQIDSYGEKSIIWKG